MLSAVVRFLTNQQTDSGMTWKFFDQSASRVIYVGPRYIGPAPNWLQAASKMAADQSVSWHAGTRLCSAQLAVHCRPGRTTWHGVTRPAPKTLDI